MKKIIILALCMFVCLAAVACGETKEEPKTNNEVTQTTESAGGTAFDQKYVSGETFDGWTFNPDPKNDIFASIVSPMANKYIMMKFEWQNTTDPKTQTEKFVKDYAEMKPTPPEEVKYGENNYWKTVYENGGYVNHQLITQKGDILVTVTLQGDGVENDPVVPKILETLKFKDVKLEDLSKP